MTLDKNNPLQQAMIKRGYAKLEVLRYYLNWHKSCMDTSKKDLDHTTEKRECVLEVIKENYNFHKTKFKEYDYKVRCILSKKGEKE